MGLDRADTSPDARPDSSSEKIDGPDDASSDDAPLDDVSPTDVDAAEEPLLYELKIEVTGYCLED